jgi:hypothetical protein
MGNAQEKCRTGIRLWNGNIVIGKETNIVGVSSIFFMRFLKKNVLRRDKNMEKKVEVMMREETHTDGTITYIVFSKKDNLWVRAGSTTDKTLIKKYMGNLKWDEVEIPEEILKRRLAEGDIGIEEYSERMARL